MGEQTNHVLLVYAIYFTEYYNMETNKLEFFFSKLKLNFNLYFDLC